MAEKTRITRKDLKKPDEFVSLTTRALLYCVEHSRQMISAAAVMVFLLGVIGLVAYYFHINEVKAQILLSRGLNFYGQGLYLASGHGEAKDAASRAPGAFKNALSAFDGVYHQYPGTRAGKLSLLYSGDCHYQLGEFDKAVESFNAFLSLGEPDEFKEVSLYEIGQSYEAMHQYDKALPYYSNLSELRPRVFKGLAYESMARCLLKLGKPDMAKKTLEQGSERLSGSPAESDRLKNLSLLIP